MKSHTHICFLRGINVSGKNMVKMKELTTLFMDLGFSDIYTYLQSGNVVFRSDGNISKAEITGKIEKEITSRFGMNVPVLVKTGEELSEIFRTNQFLSDPDIERDKLHVTMLGSVPGKEKRTRLMNGDYTPEQMIISATEIFLYCPDGYGRAKLNNNFIEKKLGVMATTRNWKTITSLMDFINNM